MRRFGLLGMVAFAGDLTSERVHFFAQAAKVGRAGAAFPLPHTGDKEYHQYDPYHEVVPC